MCTYALSFITTALILLKLPRGADSTHRILPGRWRSKELGRNRVKFQVYIPFLSSVCSVVIGMWVVVVGFIVSPMLGRSSFQKAILSGRILDLTVILGLIPRYSSPSSVYWGQVVPSNVGLLGFLQCMGRKQKNLRYSVNSIEYKLSLYKGIRELWLQESRKKLAGSLLLDLCVLHRFNRISGILFELNLFQFSTGLTRRSCWSPIVLCSD